MHRFENPQDLTWKSAWPYEEFSIVNSSGGVISCGVVGLLQVWIREWPSAAKKHHVVYVGQAFGQSGERTAWDRLKRHETVQRILAETVPDQQVWLHLAAITDLNLSIDIDGRVKPAKSDAEDDEHIQQISRAVESDSFQQREAVALAEGGLIRYFQPLYNDRMKYNFPARKQVSLESVRALDMHGLTVELQGEQVGALYGSDARPYRSLHFAGFVIHQDTNRAMTMSLSSTDAPN